MNKEIEDLLDFLNEECIPATMTADLSHDFADILRTHLDKIESLPPDKAEESTSKVIIDCWKELKHIYNVDERGGDAGIPMNVLKRYMFKFHGAIEHEKAQRTLLHDLAEESGEGIKRVPAAKMYDDYYERFNYSSETPINPTKDEVLNLMVNYKNQFTQPTPIEGTAERIDDEAFADKLMDFSWMMKQYAKQVSASTKPQEENK